MKKQRYNPLSLRERSAQLEKIVATAANPPAMRRAASLQLAQLKRTTNPQPNVQSLLAGKKAALDTFLVLAAQRSALLRRFAKLNATERDVLNVLVASMPDNAPPTARHHDVSEREHTQSWINFVQSVIACLHAVKRLPGQPNQKSKL